MIEGNAHKKHQMEHFDAAAQTLPERPDRRENVMALHQVIYNRCIRKLPLNDGDRILEVGFAWAQVIRVLAGEARFQGVGLDLSFNMAAAAAREHDRMQFLVGDAERMPFAAESFHGVLALSVLEHLPDRCAAMREMHRVLAPGGHLLLQLPVRDDILSWQFFYRTVSPRGFHALLERLAHDPRLVPTAAELREELSHAGFRLVWVRREEVFFQAIYDYYVLSLLDTLKRAKDRLYSRLGRPVRSTAAPPPSAGTKPESESRWNPRPAGIHRFLLPVASMLLLPDYLLGRCGIGASLWILARKP